MATIRRDIVDRSDELDIRAIESGLKNPWRWDWLDKCVNGVYLREVIRKLRNCGVAYCVICAQEIKYGSRGMAALAHHMETKKHTDAVKAREKNIPLPGAGGYNAESSISYGLHPMFKSCVTATESNIPLQSVPLADRIVNSEAMLLGFLAEKSLPFTLAPDLLELVKELSKDRKALNGVRMHRTAASYKLRFGVAKTFEENLVKDLRREKFSLNIDESTSNNNEKIVTVLVNYLRNGKIVTEHLQSFSVASVNSTLLFEGIVRLLEDNNIPWNNLMSVLLDSCNVMRGRKSGLESRLREKCPHLLDIDGDSCHHANNAAKEFCKPFGLYLESLFTDIHNDFKWSPDLRAALMEICEVLNVKYTMPQNYISFRWLSVYVVAQDFSRLLNALTLFYFSFLSRSEKTTFLHMIISVYKLHNVTEAGKECIRKIHSSLAEKNMTQAGKDRKNRIAEKLFGNSLTTKLITNLFVSVLPLLQEYVKLFQSGTPLIHKLHDKQLELIKSFLACFMKPEVLTSLGDSTKKIMELDIKKKSYHLPINLVFVGVKVKELIASASKSQNDKIILFRDNVMKAYVACSKSLQKKMPISNDFLKSVSSIDPMCRKTSLALKIMKDLPELVTNILLPGEKEVFDMEVHQYHLDSFNNLNEDVPIDDWWVQIKKTSKYPLLSKMACALLTCFHCPKVESSFSMMNNIITSSSTRMNISTFSAIQTIKYHLLAENKTSVAYFAKKDFLHDHVERKLVENLKSSNRAYLDEKNKKLEQKQKEINEMQKKREKIASKEAAKKLCASAAKKQREMHQKHLKRKKSDDLACKNYVAPTTVSVIKQKNTSKESCAETLVSVDNEVTAEDTNTSVKNNSLKQGVKRVNDLPVKGTQTKKRKKTPPLTIKEMFQRVSNNSK